MDPKVTIYAILKKSVSIQHLFDKNRYPLEFTIDGEYDEDTKKFIPQNISAVCTDDSGSVTEDDVNKAINEELQVSIDCPHDFVERFDEIAGYSEDKELIHEKTMECKICGLVIVVNEPRKKVRFTPVSLSLGGVINKETYFDQEKYQFLSSL